MVNKNALINGRGLFSVYPEICVKGLDKTAIQNNYIVFINR
jgi:hypothetical protein